MLKEIVFHPWTNNVLDFVDDMSLYTMQGNHQVTIRRHNMAFEIYIEGLPVYKTDDNINASHYLNQHCVGKDY